MSDLFYFAQGKKVPLEQRMGEFTLGIAKLEDLDAFQRFYASRGFSATPLLLREYSLLIVAGPPATTGSYLRRGVPKSDIRFITPVLEFGQDTKLLLLDDFRVGFHQQPSERALQEFLNQTGSVLKRKGKYDCTLTVAELDGTEVLDAANRAREVRELVKYSDPHFVRITPRPC